MCNEHDRGVKDSCSTPEHGPFARAAVELYHYGLAVLPCPGNAGKSPNGAVKGFARWKKHPGPDWIDAMARRFGGANLGIVTDLSGVTVVDVDDPALIEPMTERFGPTQLVTRTPSGGAHLWYANNGERSANLRNEGLAVDIKGRGGIIIVPPSWHRQGPRRGRSYRFVRGSWNDIGRLRPMRSDCLG